MAVDGVIKNVEDVEVLLEGLDQNNITSVLNKYNEVVNVRKKLEQLEEMLKLKAKAFLKERHWDKYTDPNSKISVSISVLKREDIDKAQLKLMLTDNQYAQVIKTSTFEKMVILTPEARERLKNYVVPKKR